MAKQKWWEQSYFQNKLGGNNSANGDPVREAPPRPACTTYVLTKDDRSDGGFFSEYRFTVDPLDTSQIRLVCWAQARAGGLQKIKDTFVTKQQGREKWASLVREGWNYPKPSRRYNVNGV